jgi:signal transduction histidine kinase
VETAADGRLALESARTHPPDLVIADVMMPTLDGFGLLDRLRNDPRTSAIPIILVSARAGEESAVESLEAGADDYLVKPFSARELIARTRITLELARLRHEAGRLSALEEIRSRVITTVSHELRTPVSAIYGASKTLEQVGLLNEETRRDLLAIITSEAERLARITSDILTAETLASGTLSITTQSFDARPLLNDAIASALATASPGIRLQALLPDDPVLVRADRARLQQVLANLVDNAVKYSPGGGEIALSLEPRDGEARIVVADHGIGVGAGQHEQIFLRFFRADPELTGGIGGTGLGLYICRELIEAMGGRIWAEPNEPRGTRLVISLPAGKGS